MLNLSEETLLLELEKAAGQDLLAAWVVLGVLMVAGFVGNVVVVVVYGRWFQPSSTRSFILALAVLDLISTGVCIPLEMFSLSHLYTFRWSAACRLVRYLSASALASFSVLALISVDRCRRVWRSGRQFRLQTMTKTLIVIIVGSYIFMIPSLIVNGIQTFHVDLESESFLVINRRLQADSAQSSFPAYTDTALLNVTGRKCDVNDDFDDMPFHTIYIGLIIAAGLVDFFIIIIMYGAIGIKAYGVICGRKMSTTVTPSTEDTRTHVGWEPQSPSKFTPSDAEGRTSDSVSVSYSASTLCGNDEGKASIPQRLSEDRTLPRRRRSASQRRHLSLRPLLHLSGSSESCNWAWDSPLKSSSWPRRRGKDTRKSVKDVPEMVQEEAEERESNRGRRKHARSQSLGHSGEKLDPPQPYCKKEPSVSLIIPGRQTICQHSPASGGNVSNQDKASNATGNYPPMEPNCMDPQGNDIQQENSTDVVQEQEARRPSGQVEALARSRQLQLRHKRITEGSRTTLMLFLVTITFVISGLPYMAAKLLELWRPESVSNLHGPSLVLYQLGLRSYFLQSAANPILYSLCVPHFRQQCRRLLSVARRR